MNEWLICALLALLAWALIATAKSHDLRVEMMACEGQMQ
jgi:hypothetical protein